MNKTKAAMLARTLMNQHGLHAVPFGFGRGKTRIGVTRFRGGQVDSIGLSSYWTEAMDETEVTDTILHEIAHALAGHKAGHGPAWRAQARAVGARPQRCAAPSAEAKEVMGKIAPPSWVGTCAKGHVKTMHRAPGRVRSCGKCSRSFSVKYLVDTWTKDGRPVSLVQMPAKYRAERARMEFSIVLKF